MSLGLRLSGKRLCVEAPRRCLSVSLPARISPPLPRGRDNRKNDQLEPLAHSTDLQVSSGDLRPQQSTAVALRRFWQSNFPSATFQNKEEFTKWYLRYSTIIVFLLGGLLVWQRYSDSQTPERIGPDHFVKLKVISRTRISPDSLLLQLDLPRDALPVISEDTPLGLNAPIQSVYVADLDSMIQRPYTPLSADVFDTTSPRNTGKLSLIVKRYETGEVSRWLHTRGVGAEVPVRGPVMTWDSRQKEIDDLVLIVAGTGITPAFQLMSSLYEPPTLKPEQQELLFGKRQNLRLQMQEEAVQEAAMGELTWLERFKVKVASIRQARDQEPARMPAAIARSPRITLLYASPSSDSILLRQTLEAYASKHPERIRIAFWADKVAEPAHTERVVRVGRMTVADLAEFGGKASDYPNRSKTTVLVCGPDGFVDAMAGRHDPASEKSAPLGGMLRSLGWRAEQVVRLDNHHRPPRIDA